MMNHLKNSKNSPAPVSSNGYEPLIEIKNAVKIYQSPSGPFTALKNITFSVSKGEFIAVIGKSGSGKSTLLNILTGIDHPTSGDIQITGTAIKTLNEKALSLFRGKNIGIVFQFFQLLPTLTIAENVMLPMDFCNTFPHRERKERALSLLSKVGIADQAHKLPSMLSGGQQQRAAIARALANDPPLITADEPTGNLDTRTSESIIRLFTDLVSDGKTIIMVTHERDAQRYVSREIELTDGSIASDSTGTSKKNF